MDYKEYFSDFLEMLANCALVICLSFAAFVLISNVYHYKEITYVHNIDVNDTQYSEYEKMLSNVDKKMKSVNIDNVAYDTTAKPIYSYYESCINSLKDGSFAKLKGKTGITARNVYDANSDILKTYNGTCIFYVPYNISVINKNFKPKKSFKGVYKVTEQKREMIIDNAEYLTKSGLGNSSYSFSTNTSKFTIYNKVYNEFELTVNNYKMIASILDDVANWYVSEYGGNS